MTTALRGDAGVRARPGLWRVTDRATFAALRSDGRRSARGALTVTWLPPTDPAASDPPRVAFAIGRSSGNAVARNRIRRRLRAGFRELQAGGRLPSGTYLVGGRAELGSTPWADLVAALDAAVRTVTERGAR